MVYRANSDRYKQMTYSYCGNSGLKLPKISFGLLHNFGHDFNEQTSRDICRKAFDLGITHFDLANNYGPPPGSAETWATTSSLPPSTVMSRSHGERRALAGSSSAPEG